MKDLTQGKVNRTLWLFCLPLLGSILFQQLYNIADSFVAGKFISDEALAAVGNVYEVTLVYLAFSFGLNIGCSVVVSRLFGAKRYGDVKTTVSTTFLAGGALCLLLMTAGYLGCEGLLRLIHTPESLMEDCRVYLYIYTAGLPFLLFYNVSTGAFSALGDSVTPFLFLACSSTLNVAMDILFVAVFHLGVAGLAWATFLCQGLSCLLAVATLFIKLKKLPAPWGKVFSAERLKDVAYIALPSTAQQLFVSVGNVVIQGVINGYGKEVMAGYAAAIKLNNLVVTTFGTLGNGVSNFTSQNVGARDYSRVKKGYGAGVIMSLCFTLPVTLLYFFFARACLGLFMQDPFGGAMEEGVLILKILSPFYVIVGIKLITDGVLRGDGKMWAFTTATFSDLFLRVGLAFLLSAQLGSLGVWLAWPVGWAVATAISCTSYLVIERKRTKNATKTAENRLEIVKK